MLATSVRTKGNHGVLKPEGLLVFPGEANHPTRFLMCCEMISISNPEPGLGRHPASWNPRNAAHMGPGDKNRGFLEPRLLGRVFLCCSRVRLLGVN